MRLPIAIASAMVAIFLTTGAAQAQTASASLMNADGQSVGLVGLKQTPNGVLLSDQFVEPGARHARVSRPRRRQYATPPSSRPAGTINPKGKKHGITRKGGMHAGDDAERSRPC